MEKTMYEYGEENDLQHIRCPVCQEGEMIASVNGETEIWICPICPAVLFTFYGKYGIDDLESLLGAMNGKE